MKSKTKMMTIALVVQILLGVVVTAFATMLLSVMSMDAPTATTSDMVMGIAIALGLIGLPTIGIPLLALRELKRYPEKRGLQFLYGNAVFGILIGAVGLVLFLLVAIWQFYLISELKNEK